ncbi:hypothetical protein [Herbaspirillum rubrisubalbicans]|uniref:hypothetical protein n=1 Tax=Herbaspirillum rubrisubalbicans TaxID=80842 RepID=UPI0015C56CB8|nr:hypothetical protein [Herbaspirillum rubrisubalbicans]
MGVQLFQEMVAPDWHLDRDGSKWIIREENKGSNNKEVQIHGCSCFAFSLDQKGKDPFPMLSGKPPGMKRVCDAMIVAVWNGKTYFCAMDLKSSNSSGATKQLEAARRTFEWLAGMAKFTGAEFNSYVFFGVINLAPRDMVRKSTSRKSAEIPPPENSTYGGYKYFQLRNHPKVDLLSLIKIIDP